MKTKFPKTVKSKYEISQKPIKVDLFSKGISFYFHYKQQSLQLTAIFAYRKMQYAEKFNSLHGNWVNTMTMTINIFISTIQSADVSLQDCNYMY